MVDCLFFVVRCCLLLIVSLLFVPCFCWLLFVFLVLVVCRLSLFVFYCVSCVSVVVRCCLLFLVGVCSCLLVVDWYAFFFCVILALLV